MYVLNPPPPAGLEAPVGLPTESNVKVCRRKEKGIGFVGLYLKFLRTHLRWQV
jgi:hypothetical protein